MYQKEKGKGLFFGKIQYFSIFLCTHLLNTVYSYFREEKSQNATSIWPETSIVAQHPQGWAGIHKAALVANILCANFPKAAIIYRPNCQFMFQIGWYQHLHLCKSFHFSCWSCLHGPTHPFPKKSPDVDKIFCPGDFSPCSFIEVTVNAYVLSSYLSNCTLEVSILSCQLQGIS